MTLPAVFLGIHRDPKDRLSSLKQVEEALDMLISSHGEYCPLPLTMDVQAENFPEVLHTRTVRRLKRQDFAFTRKMRREARQVEQSRLLRQNLLGQAVTELNFQSPETVCTGTPGGATSLTRQSLQHRSGAGSRDSHR